MMRLCIRGITVLAAVFGLAHPAVASADLYFTGHVEHRQNSKLLLHMRSKQSLAQLVYEVRETCTTDQGKTTTDVTAGEYRGVDAQGGRFRIRDKAHSAAFSRITRIRGFAGRAGARLRLRERGVYPEEDGSQRSCTTGRLSGRLERVDRKTYLRRLDKTPFA